MTKGEKREQRRESKRNSILRRSNIKGIHLQRVARFKRLATSS